jgi:pimeloyl-ACP methyl ester carboxylesterase
MRLRRDAQTWVFDWVVQQTGKVQHFQGDARGFLPGSIRQHDMISKQLGLSGIRLEGLAREEKAAGHPETALELFYEASCTFANAQHPILETNEEKQLLHGASIRCYDEVRELAPYPIERIEIPWEGRQVFANLHLCPGVERAPCILAIPGCDMTKEFFPYPVANQAIQRGMHIVSVDGPGQGECNIAGTHLTSDNYERAMSAVIDHLAARDEIDESAIAVWGLSFGSLWALRTVAHDRRPAVCVAPWASLADPHYLMEQESPRFKRLFAYLTGAETEDELDGIVAGMNAAPLAGDVTCPTLLTVGEYDPRSPVKEVVALYERMNCDRELWVFGDQHHVNTISGRVHVTERGVWDWDVASWSFDWLRDRMKGLPVERSGEIVYLTGSTTAASPLAGRGDNWIDGLGHGDRLRQPRTGA